MQGRILLSSLISTLIISSFGCSPTPEPTPLWEEENPLTPLPSPPLGIDASFEDLAEPPTPERVRLGRWLFYDERLSADGSISCSTCHIPENAFSEETPFSTGIDGQEGGRKAPSFINQAWTLYPYFFWDGRSDSLEDQALGPVANPIEMGNTIENMIADLQEIGGYAPYFNEAYGTPDITPDRVAKAIADYERTRMSGNSLWDQWKQLRNESAVSDQVKLGDELFFGKARCNQCHLGQNFTDSTFHNLGIGWNPETEMFSDTGRYMVTEEEADMGAFKTPTLRDITKHGPYMHDGSIETLREVVELYNEGGHMNPWLDPKIEPLNLEDNEIDALIALMESLEGEGYQDTIPISFPE